MRFLREIAVINGQQRRTTESRKTVVSSFRSFNRDIFKFDLLTPHEEMEKVMNATDRNSFFESAVNTATDFIMGKEFVLSSDDDNSKEQVEEYLDTLSFDFNARQQVKTTIETGNGYMEQDFMNPLQTRNILVPAKLYPIHDSSQLYINCDEYGQPNKKIVVTPTGEKKELENLSEFYIQRVNPAYRLDCARYYYLSYYGSKSSLGDSRFQVYGVPIDKRKILHIKLNLGNTGLYGRSPLASAINDDEILYQIERSIAVLAKYKAVPKKIWSLGNKEMPADEDEVDDFIFYLESLDKEDDAWVNKPVSAVDMSYSGKEMNLGYAIDHIKKKMIAGVSLDFLSGMGNDVNRATATQELLAFILSIYAKRKIFLKMWQRYIIDPYVKYKGLKPVKLAFDDLDFETKREREERIRSNWTSNMITYNEMREKMGEPVDDTGKLANKLFGEIQVDFQMAMMGGEDIPPVDFEGEENFKKVKRLKAPENFNISIETPDEGFPSKEISYETLMQKFNFIFNEPRIIEVYYKEIEGGIKLSFIQNNVLIYCNVMHDDIINQYGAHDMTNEDKQRLLTQWYSQYLNKAIKEE